MAEEKETKNEELEDLDAKKDPKGGFDLLQANRVRRRGPDQVSDPE